MKQVARNHKQKRQRALAKGLWSEMFAAATLSLRGYKILARRFRCKSGEIDIIASKKDLIIFVEVKARKSLAEAVNSVGNNNQTRIRNAADYWISKQRDVSSFSFRFDIIAVMPLHWPKHIEDAF